MADRRAQLAEAFETVEDDEKDKSELSGGDEAAVLDETDDTSVLESSDDGEETHDDDSGKASGEDGSKGAAKTVRKDSGKNDSGKDSVSDVQRVRHDKNSTPGKSAPKIEDTEKAAAEAAAKAAEIGEAPKSWKVTTREHWSKLPQDVREQINTREREITKFIGQHGAAIQHKAQFDEVVQPYLPFIAAQQSTPMKAFQGLMNTAARLTTGTPEQRAGVISEIMRNYGVTAQVLDAVLSSQLQGGGPGSGYPQPSGHGEQPPAWARPMFEFMTEAKQARQQMAQRTQQEAAAEMAKFESREFYSDLQEDMGMLLRRAADKGQLMTLEQAWEKARKMNPDVDKILSQREAAAAAKNGGTKVDRARRAASSIRGAPGVGAPVKVNGKGSGSEKPMSRADYLRAAFDEAAED